MRKRVIRQFFAVTAFGRTKSVYRVTGKVSRNQRPCLEKIALSGTSRAPVGVKLSDGTMIAICNQLIMYVPEGGGLTSFERKIEMVNMRYWGFRTSPIVALFEKEEGARSCFRKRKLVPRDPRWLDETKVVLDHIGDDHPVFEVCHYPDMTLLPV